MNQILINEDALSSSKTENLKNNLSTDNSEEVSDIDNIEEINISGFEIHWVTKAFFEC